MQRSPELKKTETTGGMHCTVQEKILCEVKALSLFPSRNAHRLNLVFGHLTKFLIHNGVFQVAGSII